jgi:hypothetical protein
MGKDKNKIELISKGRDLILKFNPYHGYHGYFSSRDAHTSFAPGHGATRERSIINENKRRIAEGSVQLVSGEYAITIKGGKATYAEARAWSKANGKWGLEKPGGKYEPKDDKDTIQDKELAKTQDIMKRNNVEYREVKPLSKALSEEEIIKKIGGPDQTKGSCASLSLTYAANKNGLDVTDYRGGASRHTISIRAWGSGRVAKLSGVKSNTENEKNDYTALKKHMEKMEVGKEYILSIGHHSSVVRKTEHGLQYMELQDKPEGNGWQDWKVGWTEKHRFGMQKSHTVGGSKYAVPSHLIDIDSLKDNHDFQVLMGYINTETGKQLKGGGGHVR